MRLVSWEGVINCRDDIGVKISDAKKKWEGSTGAKVFNIDTSLWGVTLQFSKLSVNSNV